MAATPNGWGDWADGLTIVAASDGEALALVIDAYLTYAMAEKDVPAMEIALAALLSFEASDAADVARAIVAETNKEG